MKLYAVVKSDGTMRRSVRSRHSTFCIYDTQSKAKNNARCHGDSVVAVEVDLTSEPLFIRERVVTN